MSQKNKYKIIYVFLFFLVKRCNILNVPSSNVTSLTGLTYQAVVYGTCTTGWETTQDSSSHFVVTCNELGNWLPEYTCQSKKLNFKIAF